ncbi:MAG: Holliday junction branch migration protein RuvA [Chloroflexota bacterium]|nr:MAG: Holliday junction branch migration protein RuvA [Chloroflexota bacterium]
MISLLRGTLFQRATDSIILDVNGVGYRVRVPTTTLSSLGDLGTPAELYTHLHVREDDLSLFGFATQDELDLFEMLLSVSGIGPKVALGILSSAPPNEIRAAIAQGNLEILSGIKGIGKKTAQRLVLELKGKIELGEEISELSPLDGEVAATLINLGYSAAEAQRAARAAPGVTLEDKLRAALQYLGG